MKDVIPQRQVPESAGNSLPGLELPGQPHYQIPHLLKPRGNPSSKPH